MAPLTCHGLVNCRVGHVPGTLSIKAMYLLCHGQVSRGLGIWCTWPSYINNEIDGLNYGHWIDYGVKFPCMVTAHQILVGVRFYIATRIWWVDLIERRA